MSAHLLILFSCFFAKSNSFVTSSFCQLGLGIRPVKFINKYMELAFEKIIMVNLGDDGMPKPHGKTKIEYVKDRLD